MLSLTATQLRERIEYNIEVDKKKNIIKSIGIDVSEMTLDDIVNEYTYPYVLKPYICDSFSIAVKKISNELEKEKYFKCFHKAFTMIELIATMVIASILATSVITSYSNYNNTFPTRV